MDNDSFATPQPTIAQIRESALKLVQKNNDKLRESSLLCLLSQGCEQIGKIAEAFGYINEVVVNYNRVLLCELG